MTDGSKWLGAAAGAGAARTRVVSPTLVGRGEELELLVSALSQPPAVVVIEGEAGIGKTRLVTELRARPEVGEHRFVVGACRQIREPFPLGPVLEAVRSYGDGLARARLSPVVGALRPLLPELAGLLPAALEPLGDREASRHRVFRGLVDLLHALSPVVLVLEDLHWGDKQTVDFVRYLLGEPPAGVSLVVTFRGEEVDAEVRAATAKLPASVTRAQLRLAPLDVQQTGGLAAAIVDVQRVSDEFARYLRERTGGVPFAVEEVLALLRERGVVARRNEGWARRALNELEVPGAIRDHVLERVSRLPDDARPAIQAVAVLERAASDRLVAEVAAQPRGEVAAALSLAVESGLLVDHGGAVEFRHVLAAQAVYDSVPGPRRRELHDRAASVLEAMSPGLLGQISHHLEQAGRLDEWAVTAERAADQAVQLGHDAEAVRLLETVLRDAPLESDQRVRLAVKLGRAAIETLHAVRVDDLLAQALEQAPVGAVRGELRFLLGVLLENAPGDVQSQRQLFAAAVEDLDSRPDLKAWAMVALGIRAPVGVPFSERKRWLNRALDVLPTVGEPVFEVFLLGKVAAVLMGMGDPEWRRLAERIVNETGGGAQQRRAVNAYWSLGLVACYAGHHEVADRFLGGALAGAITCEDKRLEANVRSALVLRDYCTGSWEGLSETAETLIDQLADHARPRAEAELVAGGLALMRGNLDEARSRLAALVHHIDERDGSDVLPMAVAPLARLALARGDVDTAAANVQLLLDAQESHGCLPASTRALPVVAEAMIAAGRENELVTLLERWERQLSHLDAPVAPAALAHARGFVDAATRGASAAEHFLAAAQRYATLACPYEAAQAREQAAGCLFAVGDGRAEEQLRAAVATYRKLGANWDHDRAASTARKHGISVPPRHGGGRRGYGSDPSPREREIAELAAKGLTNKEIARELFLSPETVKRHLQAAMRKLGVHSRAALADRLRGPRSQV